MPAYHLPLDATSSHYQLIVDATGPQMTSMTLQVLPVSKYDGNTKVGPFELWLDQFKLVVCVCQWEGRMKLDNLARDKHISFITHAHHSREAVMKPSQLHELNTKSQYV